MKIQRIKTYRIVLADDHELFRQGLREILDGASDLEVVGEAADGLELLNLLEHVKPHMAILDISMPRLRGIEAASEIEKKHPELKVLILTIHKDDAYRARAIAVGAEGYLLKENIGQELFPAITMIRQGQIYFPPWSELL
jgi:DNA-binding NarL/FixJ family response regulator